MYESDSNTAYLIIFLQSPLLMYVDMNKYTTQLLLHLSQPIYNSTSLSSQFFADCQSISAAYPSQVLFPHAVGIVLLSSINPLFVAGTVVNIHRCCAISNPRPKCQKFPKSQIQFQNAHQTRSNSIKLISIYSLSTSRPCSVSGNIQPSALSLL